MPFGDQAKCTSRAGRTIGGATYVGPPAVGSVYAPPVSGGNARGQHQQCLGFGADGRTERDARGPS